MKPKEKIYEFEVQNRLTSARKKAITKFFEEHGGSAVKPKATWDEKDPNILHIHTFVVEWEVHFNPKLVLVYGSGPLWARFLFTDKKRAQLRQGIHQFLAQAGFFKPPAGP